ncbi:hypothetical protein M5D96_010548 [Drosophila gunungcola]|uniref:VWFC domain-containing protein n=1 Tax=Drosophila gunungcola TaxID=103775 RepID=A0A9P9YGY5_9MUSC|nr:hypothetical protein M5D96_010548 [Drosophila gunungcola]
MLRVDQEPLPDLCDAIKCPPDAEMQCPADSAVRQNLVAVDLIKSNAVELPAPGDMSAGDAVSYNRSLISEEDYVHCCLNRNCCQENGKTPGQCCGTYDCRTEPNCTVVRDTDYHWLKQCQRCQCDSGLKICHQTCDERAEGVCQSKIPGMFYKDGETWTDNCQTCECVKGEPKCTMSLCTGLNCPSERQVKLKDTCCPVCWPKCAPMPHEKQNDDESYGDYVDETETEPAEEDPLPPLLPDPLLTTTQTQQSAELMDSTTTTTTTSSTTTSTAAPLTTSICHNAFDQPKVVEVVNQTNYVSYWLAAYSAIATIAMMAMGFYICMQRAKKRSYAPVSILDHSI